MKKPLFLFLMLILILFILAINSANAKTADAYLALYIINNPPKITGMSIHGFAETGLRCNASFEDEHKDITTLHYSWYKDGVLISNHEILDKNLIGKGDRITCKAVADDRTQFSNPENITSIVLAEPMDLKFNRITGSFVGNVAGSVNNNKEISVIGFLCFLLIILLITNITIIRKLYSPKKITRRVSKSGFY